MTLNAMMIPATGGLPSLPSLSSLGPLVLDFDTNRAEELFTFRGATDFVSAYADASPEGNDGVQTTESRQVEYFSSVSELGGAPGVLGIYAAGTYLKISGMSEAADDWTVLSAHHEIASASQQRIAGWLTGWARIIHDDASGNSEYYANAHGASAAKVSDAAQVFVWELKATNQGRVRRNGVDLDTGGTYAQTALGGTTAGLLAAHNGNHAFNGYVNRVAIFRGTLSANDLLLGERIMAAPIGVVI